MSGPQSEKVKELLVMFKEFSLNLIIECNKTTVDYLDIALNLLDGTYKPYQKPENTVLSQRIQSPSKHNQTHSNYNRNTTSNHASNETVFRHAAENYEKALKKSGYNVKLQYKPIKQHKQNKSQKEILFGLVCHLLKQCLQ